MNGHLTWYNWLLVILKLELQLNVELTSIILAIPILSIAILT
ncbi:hypothetical protein N644_2837 [Lactiplantibacillus paraplantarum]|nr:hypothetical protein N644_2837 [Lactiplantibacillus paraplantarum]